MSTNNFKFENILIVIPDFTFDEGQEYDTMSYDNYVGELFTELQKIGFEECDKWEKDNSYDGHIIAKWGLEDTDGMIKWLEVVIRNGYYADQNIDYVIDGDFGIENEQNKKQIAHYESMNRKFDRQVKKLEKILRANGEELKKVGNFSNGEAVYEKANKRKNK